jgi:cation diffusion facilitator family transporter
MQNIHKKSLYANALIIKKVTSLALSINIALSIFKLIGGYLGASQAVIADGIHSFSDCITDIVLLVGIKYWSKPPDSCHPYGHRRIETLISVVVGLALIIVSTGLAIHAIESFFIKPKEIPGIIALISAVTSIIVKELLYQYTKKIAHKIKSPSLKANAWHQRTDALSSIPVSIAIIANQIHPALYFLDSLAALLVTVFIFKAAWDILKPNIEQLSDKAASEKEIEQIKSIVSRTEHVKDVHAIRTRLSGSGMLVDLHIRVNGNMTVTASHNVADNIQNALISDGPDIIDVVVHIEPSD